MQFMITNLYTCSSTYAKLKPMKNSHAIKRSAVTGRVMPKPLGKGKAAKFAKVEGMVLTKKSATTISRFQGRGLKGDALRLAIAATFAKKRG